MTRRREIPERYQKLYKRAMTGKSRKAAIRAFCLECVMWAPKEVALCTDPWCPLYPYRLSGASGPPPERGLASQTTAQTAEAVS